MSSQFMKQVGEKFIWCLKIIWRNTYIKLRDKRKAYRYEKYWKEHRICRGLENKDKVFYIARRRDMYAGLFSFFIVFVSNVKSALEQGYIPIIDMQNSFNIYLQNKEIGHVNAWEFFFQQPMGYTLEDVKHSRNIIVGSGYIEELIPYDDYLLGAKDGFSAYKELVNQYFRLSKNAQKEVDGTYTKLIAKDDRVLGVLARGTDYTDGKPSNHPVQPTKEQLFDKVDEVLAEYQCNKIFLGTEDYEIYSDFVKRYSSMVITNQNDFVDYDRETPIPIGKVIKNQGLDLKRKGMDYLVTIAILARCNCFVGGYTSGTIGVMLFEKGFEYKYIFDLGVYD